MATLVSEYRTALGTGFLRSCGRFRGGRILLAAFFVLCSGLPLAAQQPTSPDESAPALDPQPVPPAEAEPRPTADDDPFGDARPPTEEHRETAPDLPPAPDFSDAVEQTREIVINLQNALCLASELNQMLSGGPPADAAAGRPAAGLPVVASNGVPIARKVHAIVMADDRRISGGQVNQIANGAAANAGRILGLLREQCSVTVNGTPVDLLEDPIHLRGDAGFRFERLRDAINSLDVVPNEDVLFVYIACHGLTFSDSSKPHGFQMPHAGGNLLVRRAIWDLLKSKQARQTILISDSCANRISVAAVEPADAAAANLPARTNALGALLFFNTGDVDVNGSRKPPADHGDGRGQGQFGVYTDEGGFFTLAFIEAAKNTPLPVSWDDLFVRTQQDLDTNFVRAVQVRGVPGGVVRRQQLELVRD